MALRQELPPGPDCDYLKSKYKHGYTVNVGRTHADGTVRLAREIPYDSPAWKERYTCTCTTGASVGAVTQPKAATAHSNGLD